MITWIVVAVFLICLGLLLFVPWSFEARSAVGEDELWGKVEVRWGRALAVASLRSDVGSNLRSKTRLIVSILGARVLDQRTLPRTKKPAKKTKVQQLSRRFAIARMKAVSAEPRAALRMLVQSVSVFHPRLHVSGTLGFGDPSRTATFHAAGHGLTTLTSNRIRFELADDYLSDTTQLFARFQAWMVPAGILWLVFGWVARPDTRRILRGAR